MKFLGLLLLVAGILLAPAGPLRAAASGWAQGRVVSMDGTPIAGALVSLAATARSRSTAADAQGWFSIRSLPPGTYELRVASKGFAPLTGRTIDVIAGQGTTIECKLGVQSASSLTVIGDVRVRGREALSTAAAPSATIDATAFAARGYTQVAQMLAGEPSTTMVRPLGASLNLPSFVALRGPDPTETLVAIDGHQINNGGTGAFDLSLLDPADLQNVQLIYGIAPSSLAGPNTLGGAINIRTLEPTITPQTLVRFSTGSYQTYGETIDTTGTENRVAYALSLHRLTSAGEVSNFPDALTGDTALAKVRYTFGNGGYAGISLRDQASYRDLAAALTSIDGGSYNTSPGSSALGHNAGYGVDLVLPLGASTTATLRHLTAFWQTSVNGPAADSSPYLLSGDDLIGDDTLEIVRDLPRGSFSAKLDLRSERLRTDFSSGGAVDQSIGRRPMDSSDASVPAIALAQTQRSLALRYAFDPTPKLHYTFAGYYSDFSTFGTSVDPRMGFVWTPDARSALRLSIGSTFQSPQLTELYVPPELPQPVNGYANVGNPSLRPDRATEYDAGYEHVFGNAGHPLHVALDLYRTNLRTPATLYYSPTPCTSSSDDPRSCLSYPVNAGGAVYQGAELRGDVALRGSTSLQLSYGVDSAFLTSVPPQVQDGTLVAGEQSLGVPLHTASLLVQHGADTAFSYELGMRYEGTYNELNRPPFASVQAGLGWHTRAVDVELYGTNLTNVYADKFTQLDAGVPYGGVGGAIPTPAYAMPAASVTLTLTRRL
jgi:outer membrane receptor protein involved in Fe transport